MMEVNAALSSNRAPLAASIEERERFDPTVYFMTVSRRLAGFLALMKPRVMSLAVFTAFVGLTIAPGHIDHFWFNALSQALGSGARCNQYVVVVRHRCVMAITPAAIPRGTVSRGEALYSDFSCAAQSPFLDCAQCTPQRSSLPIFFNNCLYDSEAAHATNSVIGGAAGALPPMTAGRVRRSRARVLLF